MNYHFWDMDHTLVACDCEVSWKRFLVAEGLADPGDLVLVDQFFEDYASGRLDAAAYLAFQLKDFQGRPVDEVEALALRHFQACVAERVYPEAVARIQAQLGAGAFVALLTATNRVIAAPVAASAGIPNLIATEFEVEAGRFTGRLQGDYCLGPGKVDRLRTFCDGRGISMAQVHYYGDSLPDITVLERVGHPVAVNPMPGLRERASQAGWEILDFHLRSIK
jgi:HAD superfamily hydrolase (TIGR01490 family)